MACIEAQGLRKAFGKTIALDGINMRVEEGRILGLIGPNGAGKTTALHAILGLTPYQGQLRVLGRDPWNERDQLMRDVCFIADVAVLPRWARVSQLLDYVAGVHPRFDRAKAEGFLAKTTIRRTSRVRELSKGMVTQLHLALVMAIDARLLVLDEPTLGLDILYRKQFYDSLLNDYFDHNRTIVVATHQVEEIEHVLTDVMFIDRGRIVFDRSMEELESRLSGSDGAPRAGRGGTRAQADARAPGDRRQHPAVQWGGSSATGSVGRRAHTGHRRLVRCSDWQSVSPGTRSGAMNTQSNAIPDTPIAAQGFAPAVIPESRLLYWSVMRELWESRSIYIAPLAVAALILVGHLIATIGRAMSVTNLAQRGAILEEHYSFAAFAIMGTTFVVAVFYCLDALHGERRDRSILFWKSLPVSDLTTVLSKAAIPLVVLPLLTFAITVLTQLIMVLMSSAVLLGSGLSVATLWAQLSLPQTWLGTALPSA